MTLSRSKTLVTTIVKQIRAHLIFRCETELMCEWHCSKFDFTYGLCSGGDGKLRLTERCYSSRANYEAMSKCSINPHYGQRDNGHCHHPEQLRPLIIWHSSRTLLRFADEALKQPHWKTFACMNKRKPGSLYGLAQRDTSPKPSGAKKQKFNRPREGSNFQPPDNTALEHNSQTR